MSPQADAASIESPEETISDPGLPLSLSGHYGPIHTPQPPHRLLCKQLSGEKAGEETKGLEQGGDALLFIVPVPTHGCQESDRGAPYQVGA